MEDSTDSSQLPSNCTSPVCSDPAHDDLALHAEWSDESSDCDGDGPHRDAEDQDVQDDQDDLDGQEDEEESQGVQQDLFSLSGATAPEILTHEGLEVQRSTRFIANFRSTRSENSKKYMYIHKF